MIKSQLISIALIFVCAFMSQGQSLEELLQEVRLNNLELKILENDYLAALERIPQVGELPDPEVGVGAFPLPVETRLGAQIARLSASQMFPWFGTLDSKEELEKAKADALYNRIDVRTLDILYEVKKSYYQLYEIEERNKIYSRFIDILRVLERLALTKIESGKGTASDVIRVQLKLEELYQELKILESRKTPPTSVINQILNRPARTDIDVTDTLEFAELNYVTDTLSAIIRNRHPIMKLFESQQEISRKALSLNEVNKKPSFGVGLDYIMVSPRDDAMPASNGQDIVQLRALVKVPIYNKKYSSKINEENIKIQNLDLMKDDAHSKFLAAIEKSISDYETARLKHELYVKQIGLTKSAINILETNYSASGEKFDELILLEKELIDYELKILQAIVQSHLSKIDIERYILN
jgi:outer membrane protein TolC